MFNQNFKRYRLYGLVFIETFVLGMTAGLKVIADHNLKRHPVAQGPVLSQDRLIVHEWGTLTSIAGSDGLALEWRPLTAPGELPGFVYNMQGLGSGLRYPIGKADLKGLIRMETPVIYFYADREATVSVKVDFPKGLITEWYPHARSVSNGIDWGRFRVQPGAQVALPVEAKESHYYPARETDAAPVHVCGVGKADEYEKFLFYRGVGTFRPPLSVKSEGDRVVITNTGLEGISRLILFENRGGKIAFSVYSSLSGSATIERPPLGQSLESLESELEQTLIMEGLYQKEARAMIRTWRDTWFEEGMRLFYVLPRRVTDELLPITIDPQPAELARVLVGRVEIITPEMEQTIRRQVVSTEDTRIDSRAKAAEFFGKYGRFAEPILKRIMEKENDRRVRDLIERIIETANAR